MCRRMPPPRSRGTAALPSRATPRRRANLGGMYDRAEARGVPPDAAAAVAWYRRAAEQGDARAQYNLGGMYREGRGVPQDAAGAVAWYRRAAEQGHVRAQYNLGGMYAEGLGVPPDAVEALMWLTIAAARSTGAEREHMVTARAAVASRMTPTDVREAERRAQAWLAAHPGMRNRAAPPQRPGTRGRDCRPSRAREYPVGRDRWSGTPLAVRRRHIAPAVLRLDEPGRGGAAVERTAAGAVSAGKARDEPAAVA